MKLINDYIISLRTLGLTEGYIPVSKREWRDLMDGEEYVGPVIKDYGDVRVTIEILED